MYVSTRNWRVKIPDSSSLDGGGDVFVGGAVPFGMVKMGLDTYEEPVNQSALNGGWTPKGYVTGISLMHESGTGGGPKYGFPAQMPLTSIDGDVNLLDNRTYWQKRVRKSGKFEMNDVDRRKGWSGCRTSWLLQHAVRIGHRY